MMLNKQKMTICQLWNNFHTVEEAWSLSLNALECVYKTWILSSLSAVTRSKKRRDLTICWLDISQNIKEPTIQSEQYQPPMPWFLSISLKMPPKWGHCQGCLYNHFRCNFAKTRQNNPIWLWHPLHCVLMLSISFPHWTRKVNGLSLVAD